MSAATRAERRGWQLGEDVLRAPADTLCRLGRRALRDRCIARDNARDGSIYSGSIRVLSAHHDSTGTYTVTVDRDLTGCSVAANVAGGMYYVSAYISGNIVVGDTWALSSTGTATDTDLYWYFTVAC